MTSEKVSDNRLRDIQRGEPCWESERTAVVAELLAHRAERPALLAVVNGVASDLEWMTHGGLRCSDANLRDCAKRLRALAAAEAGQASEPKSDVRATCWSCHVSIVNGVAVAPHSPTCAAVKPAPSSSAEPTAEQRADAMFRTPYQDLDMLHSRAIGAIRAAVQAAEARVRKECGGDIRAAALHILERRAEKAEADLARLQGLRGRKDGEARPHACPICMGQGFVYDMACTAPQKPCPACNGARVLWGPPA